MPNWRPHIHGSFSRRPAHCGAGATCVGLCEPPPPITELLWREGSAWAALLKLHSGVIAAARHAAGGGAGDEQLTLAREVVEAREGTYCAALTSLAAQAEALASESLKLRSLRRVRSSEEQLAIATLLEAHTVEALAMGASLASNMAVSTQAVSSELRRASQHARTELTQLHTLLQALRERADEPLRCASPYSSTTTMGRTPLRSTRCFRPHNSTTPSSRRRAYARRSAR